MPEEIHCFSTRATGRRCVLKNQLHISEPPVDPRDRVKPVQMKEFTAIWDTGATNSAITAKVVQECNLKPTGIAVVNTPKGDHKTRTYLVDIVLPNKVGIRDVVVSEAIVRDTDVLIGMDIIGLGDFAVSNKDGMTVFTFRIPSMECIDFVDEAKKQAKPSRNKPCPCGSGKKYKHCHGKQD